MQTKLPFAAYETGSNGAQLQSMAPITLTSAYNHDNPVQQPVIQTNEPAIPA